MMPYGYDKPITSFGREFITTANPSKNFIKRVERNLPVNSNDSSIALKLYNNLNSCFSKCNNRCNTRIKG